MGGGAHQTAVTVDRERLTQPLALPLPAQRCPLTVFGPASAHGLTVFGQTLHGLKAAAT